MHFIWLTMEGFIAALNTLIFIIMPKAHSMTPIAVLCFIDWTRRILQALLGYPSVDYKSINSAPPPRSDGVG